MAMAQYCTNIIWPLNLSVVTIAISMTVSTTVAMSVSMTVSSMTIAMTVSTISTAVSTISTIAVVSISISLSSGLSISTPLVEPGDLLEGLTSGVELADGTAGGESVTGSIQVTGIQTDRDTIAVESISISTPLADVAVSTISMVAMESLGRPVDVGRGAVSVVSDAKTVSTISTVAVSAVVSISISVSTPLAVSVGVSTGSIDGGLEAKTVCRRPGKLVTVAVSAVIGISVSLWGGQGGNSQTSDEHKFLHIAIDDPTHWSTEL